MINPRYFRILNITANSLLILMGVLLITLLAYRALYQPSLDSLGAELIKKGDELRGLQEVDFKQTRNTILLAMDANCRFCTASIPFYQKLIDKSRQNSAVRIVALFINKNEEVENYLRENDLAVEFIPNVDLVKLKVDTTPTVIWVDANRKIVGSYQGFLPEKQEIAFFELYEKKLSGN